jgi:hypothetical protein
VDKNRQEDVVRASDLDWVLVRPTVLNDKPARGSARACTDLSGIHGGTIARADVATFVVDQLTNDTWLRRAPLITWWPDDKRVAARGGFRGVGFDDARRAACDGSAAFTRLASPFTGGGFLMTRERCKVQYAAQSCAAGRRKSRLRKA